METETLIGLILAVLSVGIWIADIYASRKLKSYLTPEDRYQRTRYDEETEED